MVAERKDIAVLADARAGRAHADVSDEVALALAEGNLASLTGAQKAQAVRALCAAADLPVALTPILFLPAQGGKLVPYITAAGSNTIRNARHISVVILSRERMDGMYIVTARATTPDGRTDEATGVVPIDGLRGVELANAMMRGETKAKRRATISLCGLGIADESELDGIRATGPSQSVNVETGEVIEAKGSLADFSARASDIEPEHPAPRRPSQPKTETPALAMFRAIGNRLTDEQIKSLVWWLTGEMSTRDLPPEAVADLDLIGNAFRGVDGTTATSIYERAHAIRGASEVDQVTALVETVSGSPAYAEPAKRLIRALADARIGELMGAQGISVDPATGEILDVR